MSHPIKEAFLDLLADGKYEISYDADTNDSGRMVDCSTFTISGDLRSLETFLEALGMTRKRYDESVDEMLQREIEGESSGQGVGG